MQLLRADSTTTVFADLESQWRSECEAFGECFDEYAEPYMRHAREITNGGRSNDSYSIYVLEDAGKCECLAHFNVAELPRTSGRTLRILWILLAPRYDYEDVSPDSIARLGSGLFEQAIHLAYGADQRMKADHIKIHLNGIGDRRYFGNAIGALRKLDELTGVGFRGNWLHMSINQSLAIAS